MSIQRRDPGIQLGRRSGRRRDERSIRILALQLLEQLRIVIAKLHEAYAALCAAHHEGSKLRSPARVGNGLTRAAGAIGRRRHAQTAIDLLVDAANRTKAGFKYGAGDRIAGAQAGLQPPEADSRLELLRRDAESGFKAALQMRRAEL